MTTPQQPIPSEFGATSSADDVLAGVDLHGQTALVTGGYSGIGLETTRALVRAGAEVIVPARRVETAQEALTGVPGVEIGALDLGDLSSVEAFAAGLLDRGRPLNLIINSAGVMASPLARVGGGWESQFATNHLGHFALINRIWPLVRPGGRVVAVSSAGHRRSPMRWDDPMFEQGYDKWTAYGQSKTANALFAVELDRLARQHGIRAFSINPGGIMTPLQRHLPQEEMVAMGWIDEDGRPLMEFKSPEQGAATQVWAATSPRLAGLGGVYCEDCDIAKLAETNDRVTGGVRPYAIDPEQARRLWDLSAELTGVDAFVGRAG